MELHQKNAMKYSLPILSLLLCLSACGRSGDSSAASAAPAPAASARATPKSAAWLAAKLNKPARFLVGLGSVDVASIQKQQITSDIYDQYLNGVGEKSWRDWNKPDGAYVAQVAKNADALGAVPMFTLYQMAALGDGDLSGLQSAYFMSQYWSNVRLLFKQLGSYGKPALVNFEPDFWGYAQRAARQADPATVFAYVGDEPECAGLPNHVGGMAACLIRFARQYAPQALVGFPPSLFGDLHGSALGFMQKLGAADADFIVMQTLDRDAGCFENLPQTPYCTRAGKGWYWDENKDFTAHFALAKTYHDGLGLPLLWWQTPLGVPGDSPGAPGKWRDNRVRYFLTHAAELVAAGGAGAVFSAGEVNQTTINSDGGQFKELSTQYLARPAALE